MTIDPYIIVCGHGLLGARRPSAHSSLGAQLMARKCRGPRWCPLFRRRSSRRASTPHSDRAPPTHSMAPWSICALTFSYNSSCSRRGSRSALGPAASSPTFAWITPGFGLAQVASDLNANLIVVGTHGRRGLARVLMGSVAEATLRHARCPVLVIPQEEQAPEVKIDPPCPACLLARSAPGSQEIWCSSAPRTPRSTAYLSPKCP